MDSRFMKTLQESHSNYSLKLRDIGSDEPNKRLVSLIFEKLNCFPMGNETVYFKNKIIGVTTSAAFGFRINKPIALAVLNNDTSHKFNKVKVKIGQDFLVAKVIEEAAYDPTGEKMRCFQ